MVVVNFVKSTYMKTISDYKIFCTPEQTKKAFELGAPIEYASITDIKNERFVTIDKEYYCTPTVEEMIGWLETQGLSTEVFMSKEVFSDNFVWSLRVSDENENITIVSKKNGNSRKAAFLAAIDDALEYLSSVIKKNNMNLFSKFVHDLKEFSLDPLADPRCKGCVHVDNFLCPYPKECSAMLKIEKMTK